jgi:hypothetical protein
MDQAQEAQLSSISKGRSAELAWSVFRPIIESQKVAALLRATQAYRAREGAAVIEREVAILCAIEDLEVQITQFVNQGRRAEAKVLNG